jgi:beta-lactamase superfamily II metal-dependent hydrolase
MADSMARQPNELPTVPVGVLVKNTSAVLRYAVNNGASFLWLGDLETEFMENITDSIELKKTTVVFASHHGRDSGKIPTSWLERLDPQIIVIGEAPSRYLNYYTGYQIITQNEAGDITMDCDDGKVHFYVSDEDYRRDDVLTNEGKADFPNYIGSITVETEYTL